MRRMTASGAALLAVIVWAPCLPFLSARSEETAGGADGPAGRPGHEEPPAEKTWPFKLKSVQEDPNDAARVAREIVATFMSDADFKAKAAEIRKKYERWREEYREDMDRYLNDRLVSVALAATSGKVEKLKEGAVFLAYYHEFRQPVPSLVTDFVGDNLESLNRFFAAFAWERGSAYVKAKQWRKDLDEKRRREEEERKKSASGPAREPGAKTVSGGEP